MPISSSSAADSPDSPPPPLPRHGCSRVLAEAAEPAGSWPRYYDSLTLFSPARYSSLPGMPFPGADRTATRTATKSSPTCRLRHRLHADIRTSTSVTSVAQQDGPGPCLTSDGRKFTAGAVVAATGDYGTPFTPDLPGRQDFGGQALHAADYRSPDVFAGKRVVVVGGGNSAIQIAADLGVVADPPWPAGARSAGCPSAPWPGPMVAQAHPPGYRHPTATGEGPRLCDR